MIPNKLRNTIIIIVTSIWAINFLAGLIPPLNYKPDQAINAIFMGIVGGLFAIGARNNGKDKDDHRPSSSFPKPDDEPSAPVERPPAKKSDVDEDDSGGVL